VTGDTWPPIAWAYPDEVDAALLEFLSIDG
jgi:hypothetical protein